MTAAKKKVIAFSLWGNLPKYSVGALKNARLAEQLYPGWICRFYVGSSTPAPAITELSRLKNVEIVRVDEPGDWKASVWRFFAAGDDAVEVMISRDADSRLTARERDAVNDWLASDKKFHIMRDHPWHASWPILAGMWGVRGGLLNNIRQLLEDHFFHSFPVYQWGVDQVFLGRSVHPLVRADTLVHDDLSPPLAWDGMSVRRRFPTPRHGYDFVGQVFDENDLPVKEHLDVLAAHLRQPSR